MEISPNVRYPDQTDAGMKLSSRYQGCIIGCATLGFMPPAKPNLETREKFLPRTRKSSFADAIALFSAAVLVCIDLLRHANGPAAQKRRMLLALVITTGFALVAWLARGVDAGGALAGSSIAFVLAFRDLRMFWVLLLVFAVTLLATRTGKSRKKHLHTLKIPAEGRRHR